MVVHEDGVQKQKVVHGVLKDLRVQPTLLTRGEQRQQHQSREQEQGKQANTRFSVNDDSDNRYPYNSTQKNTTSTTTYHDHEAQQQNNSSSNITTTNNNSNEAEITDAKQADSRSAGRKE